MDFASLTSLRTATIRQVTTLRERPTHRVCRVTCDQGSYILKWFNSPATSLELQTYALLSQVGVATLPVYERTGQALLLEDLESSLDWRQATEEDLEWAATGRAVGEWYRALHRAGREALGGSRPDWLRPWVSVITRPALIRAGEVLQLQAEPAWKSVLEGFEALKASYLALPQTFNYSDFAAENLALSRGEASHRQAVVFDYDCFSTGLAASDCRNVLYSLQGAAREAFRAAYGPIAERELLLDEPLAILEGLVVASQRNRLPGWARPLLASVANGELERAIRKAREIG